MEYFDALMAKLPNDYNTEDPLAEDGINSFVEVRYGPSKNQTFIHAFLTAEQFEYWSEDPSIIRPVRQANQAWFKLLNKQSGSDIAPFHVFGNVMIDYETGEMIYPNTKDNEIPDPIPGE